MSNIKEGDIVARKSYNRDVFFKVMGLFTGADGKEYANLKGLDIRLCASSWVNDLERIDAREVAAYWHNTYKKNQEVMDRVMERRKAERCDRLNKHTNCGLTRGITPEGPKGDDVEGFDMPGSVLHLDGDKDYLNLCLTTYRNLSIPAHGYDIKEQDQAKYVAQLLKKHNPDILVLTGHDGCKKGARDLADINNYYNSLNFVEAVKIARNYEKNRDDLVIFAGACQSHYEALLNAGANFASSPKRVVIHAFDPVFVVEKIAFTSIYEPIVIRDIIRSTITGFDGIGGLETSGKYRLGVPKGDYMG